MDYKQATDFLYSQLPMFSRTGGAAYKPGLQTSEALDRFFGHPHEKFRSIHIAGTNGKGSTSHIIASALQEQGYKTALYTSPHLVDFRERIKINGQMIPEKAVADFVERFINSGYEDHPSFFELTMMLAFDWFARENVDVAVIEVGMGGRLDSTNIITPEACVITNISKDHTQFLGNTPEQIAAEKAGIIKPCIPVTVGEKSSPAIAEVFRTKAEAEGAPIRFAEDNTSLSVPFRKEGEEGWNVESSKFGRLHIPLDGDYQRHNLLTAVTALEMLSEGIIPLDTGAVKRGLGKVVENTGLAGRWMKCGENPLIICDTGHNEAGIKSNMRRLREWREAHPEATLHIVAGFVADKDVVHILPFFPKDARYVFTQADIPRAMPAEKVAELAAEAGLRGEVIPNVSEAVARALADAGKDDLVFVGGSTFVVADFLGHR